MAARRGRHRLRFPRTTQEKRAYYGNEEYVRPKRRPRRLADAWDDIPVGQTKNWKKRRKTQYRHNSKRFQWYTIKLDWCRFTTVTHAWQIVEHLQRRGFYYIWDWKNSTLKWYGEDCGCMRRDV